ncbi:hypothetical protein SAMN05444678_12327 [Sphingomonas sp. YR710]|nr:hypothetical protein SAMN05444678_12327 [Sphingomonas sp. YR710]
MDVPGAVGIMARVKAEQNGDGFLPIGAIGIGVEEAQVELHMLDVIVGERRALRRFVEKIGRGHDGFPGAPMARAIRFRVGFNEVLNRRKLQKRASRDAADVSIRTTQSFFVGGLPFSPFKKRDRINVEDDGELFQHVDRRGMLFPLKHTDIVAIDLGTVSKFLLRQAPGVSQSTQISGDDLAQSHAERSPFPLIYYHLVN